MATLNIGGQRVKVDDAFLSMPPDQQQAAVEEIAASLGGGQSSYDQQAVSAGAPVEGMPQPFAGGPTPGAPREPGRPDLMGSIATTLAGINTVPVVGPALQMTSDAIMGGGSALMGGDYGETVRGLQDRRAELARNNPIANLAGSVGANLAAGGIVGAPRAVAAGLSPAAMTLAGGQTVGSTALGLTGSTAAKAGSGLASTVGLLTADEMLRGEKPTDALRSSLLPGAIAGAIPVAGEGIKRASGALYNGVLKPIQTAFNRENEAIGRIGKAIEQGKSNPMAPAMSQADEMVAREAGIPVINADRGGAPLRTLARTAANTSPEASAALNSTVSNRFETQAPRAVSFVKKLMGGATDDLALQDSLRLAARKANKPAYDAAYNSPQARAIWTPEIRNLMQAKPFQAAINAAEDTAANSAAVSGGKAVRNPFVFKADGTIDLRTMPDGSRALPNLEFWDIVQRNLRNTAEVADRSGDKLLASQTRAMRDQLVNQLDNAVPQFNKARSGAAAFFGAEDAIDAGKKFATQPKTIPEATRAFNQMAQAEKEAFAIGYSSELIDTIKSSRDRVNVINQVFGSPARREMNALALGPQKARELEAYVRVEGIVQSLKDAVGGNSTTAQQLIASGALGTTGGYFASGGDIPTALTAGAIVGLGRRGMQVMGKRVDEQVMARIGEMLTSSDPKMLERAIQNASLSAEHRLALEAIQTGLEAAAKGAVFGTAASAPQIMAN